ncbi:MAG: YigZ family protein [Myxococcota bacterium]
MTAADAFKTIASAVEAELDKVKGSRFVARAAPVTTGPEAQAVVAGARADYPDATHHCWAYRLAPPKPDFRWSDAGEPANTAGRPILQRIDGLQLMNVAVVVSRWFGGTKLGPGGLMRAYGDAARAALDAAEIVSAVPMTSVHVSFEYALSGPIQGVLAAFGLAPSQADYGADVAMDLPCPVARVAALVAALGDASAGRAKISLAE